MEESAALEHCPPASLSSAGRIEKLRVKFLVSDSIRQYGEDPDRQQPSRRGRHPRVRSAPGHGRSLFLKMRKPIKSLDVEPQAAIEILKTRPTKSGWQSLYPPRQDLGPRPVDRHLRRRQVQTIQYFVTKPNAKAVADMGHFFTTRQWYADPQDPFHRAPSVMTYDRETNQIVLQDGRVWIAGLGDEGGAGSWLAATMKELVAPNQEELQKLSTVRGRRSMGRAAICRMALAHTAPARACSTISPTSSAALLSQQY